MSSAALRPDSDAPVMAAAAVTAVPMAVAMAPVVAAPAATPASAGRAAPAVSTAATANTMKRPTSSRMSEPGK